MAVERNLMPASLPDHSPSRSSGLPELFELASGRQLCLLDGSGWSPPARRFYDADAVFSSKNGHCVLRHRRGAVETSQGDPFRTLDELLRRHPEWTAVGYWSYDLRHHVERLPRRTRDDLDLPDCWVGLYRAGSVDCTPAPVERDTPIRRHVDPTLLPELDDSATREEYQAAIRKILEYISAGDCYQVNLSHRLSYPAREPAWTLYERLRNTSPAPFAAFLDCGDHQVLSSSPELFLAISDGQVETRPIKGTRPRGATPEQDAELASELQSSIKDRAELLMIVDLERNDLGRVCSYGSVHVPDLFRLETYANVHHLVATVRGELRPEVTPLECLRAAFPGGSITGAPKIRAMEIIEELETYRRGVYTGAIGWVDGHGRGEWNIAIRTLVRKGGRAYFSVGGGIVADSDPAAEYEETFTKAQGLLRALC